MFSTEIKGVKIEPAIMNASGIFSFPAVLKRLSPYFGAVVTKSISLEEREGYETPVFVQLSDDEYVNAIGLANPGYKEMKKELEEHYPYFQSIEKPIIQSIFGSTAEELCEIVEGLDEYCDMFEINYSCPHPKPDEIVGMALGSDAKLVKKYTNVVRQCTKKPLIAKLSPNIPNLIEVAEAALIGGADALSAINTVGPVEYENEYGYYLLSNKKGGRSGRSIKQKGIETVRKLRSTFPDAPIIGMGGIYTAQDIIDYKFYAGADAVAIGTVFDLMDTDEIGKYMTKLLEELKDV